MRQDVKEFDVRTEFPLEWNNCLFISNGRRRFEVQRGVRHFVGTAGN